MRYKFISLNPKIVSMRSYLIIALISFVVVVSGCLDVDQDPDQMAESYVYNLQSEDFEAAYGHLSEDVQEDVELEEFEEEKENILENNAIAGISYDIIESEVIEESEGSATVEISMRANVWGAEVSERTEELELKETDVGSWELQSYWKPLKADLDSENVDQAIEDSIIAGSSDWNNYIEDIEYIDVSSGEFKEEDLDPEYVNELEAETPYTVEDLRIVQVEVASREPGFLGDDYLMMQWVATDAFEEIFQTHGTILAAEVKVDKQTEDEFGNEVLETLGVAQMDTETASQINWENFDYENLNEVTHVDFEGDSLYQDLERYEEYGTTW